MQLHDDQYSVRSRLTWYKSFTPTPSDKVDTISRSSEYPVSCTGRDNNIEAVSSTEWTHQVSPEIFVRVVKNNSRTGTSTWCAVFFEACFAFSCRKQRKVRFKTDAAEQSPSLRWRGKFPVVVLRHFHIHPCVISLSHETHLSV